MDREKRRMKIEDIESNLNKLPVIYFSDKNKTFNNINEIIRYAINSNYLINNSTRSRGRLQCRENMCRGIADIYRICKYYFPNTTLKEVVTTIKTIPTKTNYCYTTNQDVYRLSNENWIQNFSHRIKCIKEDPSIRLKNRKRVYIEKE